ncbi:MAG: spermidine/putrescine ABC transporter substrate-binding protein [Eubacteriales bacterium]|nr:spermidine/putrescine ABC transporter substrate-binding protein [Eubacteriales bacterium]
MKKVFCFLLVFLLALSLFTVASAEGMVTVYNWEEYISPDAIKLFEEETGITVNMTYFTTNEDMMVQVRNSPSSFDVVIPSDYCTERLLKEGLLEEINFDNVPNYTNIDKALEKQYYDPDAKYTVPYMWGTVGICYNKTMVDEPITSWSVLFDTKYKDNVFMLDSIRDSMGIALKYLGYSMNTVDPLEINAAKELLLKQKKDGIVKAYQVDETKDKMVAGEAALALMWNGDAMYAIALNEDLDFVIPDEGSNIWVDTMIIPKGAKNKENAEKFINFMCRPDIAQMNFDEIWYSTPNLATVELIGEEYTSNHVINPSQEVRDRCEYFHDIDDKLLLVYNTMWTQIKSSK